MFCANICELADQTLPSCDHKEKQNVCTDYVLGQSERPVDVYLAVHHEIISEVNAVLFLL